MFAWFAVAGAALGAPLYGDGMQVHQLFHVSITAYTGQRELPIRFTFPVDGGPFPVIVFSHGFLGSAEGYDPLIRYWAERGYVVVQPTHADSLIYRQPRPGFNVSLQGDLKNWAQRPTEISFIIDHLAGFARTVPGLAGKMDLSKIGVGGHSFGANTAELVGGVVPKSRVSFADSRPKAILEIAPTGAGTMFTPNSWVHETRPLLVVIGSKDRFASVGGRTARIDAFENVPHGAKYLLWVEGAQHDYGGITGARWYPNAGPRNPSILAWTRSTTLAFWDSFLKGSPDAGEFINQNNVQAASRGQATIRRR